MSWPEVKLEDVCKVLGGTTPSTTVNEYWDGDVTWLSPVDLPEVGTISHVADSKKKITTLAVEKVGLQMLPKGSLVFSSRASIGKIGIVTKPLTTNQGFTNFIPSETIDVRYLAYALKNGIPAIEQLANSTTFKEVSRTALKNFKIPLPPLHIQQHIADTLDKADALRRKDQELLKKYDELAQSIFYDMFGDPVRNEKGWKIKTLENVIQNIEAGTSVGGEDRILKNGEYGVLKISSVTSGQFVPSEYKVPEQNRLPKILLTPQKGDLLFSRANTRELVGATAVVDKNYDSLFLPDKLWKLVLSKGTSPYFVKYILSNTEIRYELNKTATGTSGSMLNISMKKLLGLKIPVPPPNVQIHFEHSILQLKKQTEILKSSSSNTSDLFSRLISSTFS